MKRSEVEAKIEKIKAMSGISDSAKADMIAAWEKKLPAENVPGFKHLKQKKDGTLVVESKGEFLERWVPLVAEHLKAYTGLSKAANLKKFSDELTGEKSKEMYERGVKAGEAARFLTHDKDSKIGQAADNAKTTSRGRKKSAEPKVKTKSSYKFNGKYLYELNEEECAEAIRESKERREKAAKAEKKSKRRPVMEKVTANVVKAVKQTIENIPAADLKDAPKTELKNIDRVITAAKNFVRELKSILGDDFDKDTIDGEFKELHALAKELHKKYGE